MGSKSFEQPLEFNGELAYNDPRHIEGAACMYKDGVEIQNLTENDDGVTYINDRGDIFKGRKVF